MLCLKDCSLDRKNGVGRVSFSDIEMGRLCEFREMGEEVIYNEGHGNELTIRAH